MKNTRDKETDMPERTLITEGHPILINADTGRTLWWYMHPHDRSGDQDVFISSGPHPFPEGKPTKRHHVFDKHGRWIGDDLKVMESPHRVVTQNCIYTIGAQEAADLFIRYAEGDYGTGEAGFATYKNEYDDEIWIIDDAVRTPEGEPPARDPKTSPGPLTMLLPEDY